MKSTISDIQKRIIAFRDARDWKQFHNPKDVAISLVLEAAEVMEHFQWKSQKEVDAHISKNKDKIADELVDTLYWVLLMAHDLNIDLDQSFERKMAENEQKYEVGKAKGSHKKYTELQ